MNEQITGIKEEIAEVEKRLRAEIDNAFRHITDLVGRIADKSGMGEARPLRMGESGVREVRHTDRVCGRIRAAAANALAECTPAAVELLARAAVEIAWRQAEDSTWARREDFTEANIRDIIKATGEMLCAAADTAADTAQERETQAPLDYSTRRELHELSPSSELRSDTVASERPLRGVDCGGKY